MGVCEEYAQSFTKICDLLSIESQVLKGNARNNAEEIGVFSNTSNHAWNVVKIDEKWLIIDATWGAGFEQNGVWVQQFTPYYFDIPYHKILKSHLPFDKAWLLRFGRITDEQFFNQPIFTDDFLITDATLVNPKSGIIKINNDDDINIVIKNLKATDKIAFGIKGLRFAMNPEVKIVGENTVIKIPNPKRQGILTLIINQKSAIYFKMI
ncbi:MAG: hypothetical protein HC798_03630 [Polaribacter sp.]|nr:hypothetical protein [Polaribacter sp.]